MSSKLKNRIQKLEDKLPKGVTHVIFLEQGESAEEGRTRYEKTCPISDNDKLVILGLKG